MAENMKARLHAGALVVFLVVFALVFLLVVITSTLITFILPESFASSTRIKIERKPMQGWRENRPRSVHMILT